MRDCGIYTIRGLYAPTLTLDDYYQTGFLIGTNLKNANDGPYATGKVEITDGGTAHTAHVVLGNEQNTSGHLLVSGTGSEWQNYSSTSVGIAGSGSFTVEAGGLYQQRNADTFFVGYGATGSGTVAVSGADGDGNRSSLITRGQLHLGDAGNAMVRTY